VDAEVQRRAQEIQARLLRDRIVFIGTPIDDYIANLSIGQLRQMAREDSRKSVSLYLNSPGGYLSSSFAIVDALDGIPCQVATYVVGQAAGTALILAAHGAKGMRFALPESRFVFCPLSGPDDRKDDVAALSRRFVSILAADSDTSELAVRSRMECNEVFSAEEAVRAGLIDEVCEELSSRELRARRRNVIVRKRGGRGGPGAQGLH
jgi:ATP-dependent Clp protease protease subunit